MMEEVLRRVACMIALLCLVSVLSAVSEAKVFERCELAELLRRYGFSTDEVAKWVCIAQHSSGLNSEAYASSLEGGSHGIFQISDVFWCSPPGKGFGCEIPCERLRDVDLLDDFKCIRQIYAEHERISGNGYDAWRAYDSYCREGSELYIAGCLHKMKEYELEGSRYQVDVPDNNFLKIAAAFKSHTQSTNSHLKPYLFDNTNDMKLRKSNSVKPSQRGKTYGRCELAKELYYRHKLPLDQIPTWVCIAQHESLLNTAAVGHLNADGSADYGLFQISDLYWCSKNDHVIRACGLKCSQLLDDDISDDVRCIRRIYREHFGISGDGFTAWAVYNRDCRDQQYEQISNCFIDNPLVQQLSVSSRIRDPQHDPLQSRDSAFSYPNNEIDQSRTGKVYERCELARELYHVHKFPREEITTWVCIAEHDSSFYTGAVGRLNGDGSSNYGLFQISDRYWCSNENSPVDGGNACHIPCDKLVDSDITDDVRCLRTIYAEHVQISGNGFDAWTAYIKHCRHREMDNVLSECLEEFSRGDQQDVTSRSHYNFTPVAHEVTLLGKVYDRCELAHELYFEHEMGMNDIPTWVCIAQHESNFNTAAVGRLNADGSADHGLFQISDLYWCSHDAVGGKGCNISCSKLEDSNIADDVHCIRTIYDEHTRISGDGFTAWAVYGPHCRHQQLDTITDCFDDNVVKEARIATFQEMVSQEQNSFPEVAKKSNWNEPRRSRIESYKLNPFLSQILVEDHLSKPKTILTNPFLNDYLNKNQDGAGSHHRHGSTYLSKSLASWPSDRNESDILNPFISRFIQDTTKLHAHHPHESLMTSQNIVEHPQGEPRNSKTRRPVQTTKKYIQSESFRTKPTTVITTKSPLSSTFSFTNFATSTAKASTKSSWDDWLYKRTTRKPKQMALRNEQELKSKSEIVTKTSSVNLTTPSSSKKPSSSNKPTTITYSATTTIRPTDKERTSTTSRSLTKALYPTTKTTSLPKTKAANKSTTKTTTSRTEKTTANTTRWSATKPTWPSTKTTSRSITSNTNKSTINKAATSKSFRNWWERETSTTTVSSSKVKHIKPLPTTTSATPRVTSVRHMATATTASPITTTSRRPQTSTVRSTTKTKTNTRQTTAPTKPTTKLIYASTTATTTTKAATATIATSTQRRPSSSVTYRKSEVITKTATTKRPTKFTTQLQKCNRLIGLEATPTTTASPSITKATTQKSIWRWAAIPKLTTTPVTPRAKPTKTTKPTPLPTKTTPTTTMTKRTAATFGKSFVSITNSTRKSTRATTKSTTTRTSATDKTITSYKSNSTAIKQTERGNSINNRRNNNLQHNRSTNKSDPFSHPFFAKFFEKFELSKTKKQQR